MNYEGRVSISGGESMEKESKDTKRTSDEEREKRAEKFTWRPGDVELIPPSKKPQPTTKDEDR